MKRNDHNAENKIQSINGMEEADRKIYAKKIISWQKDFNPEPADRLEFVGLSSAEKWDHIMSLILITYPSGKKVTFNKRIIEWI
jgi:hypothetical protein